MFSRVDAFVRDVRELKTEDQLAEALGDVSNDLGFRFFALTLGHAPPPLTANGLDMRDGHPANEPVPYPKRGSHASALIRRSDKLPASRHSTRPAKSERSGAHFCAEGRCSALWNSVVLE